MPRVFTLLLSIAVTLSAATLEVGAAKRNITPSPLLPISGGMGIPTPAKAKQGELMVRAVVLRSGSETLAIVSLDVIGFPSVVGDKARALVPRIPADHILIGSTHTHSAPDCYAYPDGRGGHTGSLEYIQHVTEQIGAAVNDALDHLQPAEARSAMGEAKGKIAYNYYAPDLYDRRASVMQFRSTRDNATIATLVNYAVHPEILGSKQGILSPDLVGPLCERLEKESGGMGIFMNSAQGGMVTADVRDFDKPIRDPLRAYWQDRGDWAECERVGNLLATESLRIVKDAAWEREPAVAVKSKMVQFPVESEEMWQVVTLSPLQYPHGPGRNITTRMVAIQLGKAQIVTIPGEALPNIGMYLKRKMHGQSNFLFGLTNDAFGYILTRVDFKSFQRYEYVSRVSLGENTGEILIENALELIRALN